MHGISLPACLSYAFFGSLFFFVVSASPSFHRMVARAWVLSYFTASHILLKKYHLPAARELINAMTANQQQEDCFPSTNTLSASGYVFSIYFNKFSTVSTTEQDFHTGVSGLL